MVIAVIVVVAAVVFLARGRGGGLSAERNDYVPLDLGPVSATDVALLRPPTGLWGYNMQATDEALEQIAESIRERDVRIVALEQLVTDLSRDHAPMPLLASPYAGARHRRAPVDTTANTAETEAVQAPRDAPADGGRPGSPSTRGSRRSSTRRSRSASPSSRQDPAEKCPARRSGPMTDAAADPADGGSRRGRWPGRTAGCAARGG